MKEYARELQTHLEILNREISHLINLKRFLRESVCDMILKYSTVFDEDSTLQLLAYAQEETKESVSNNKYAHELGELLSSLLTRESQYTLSKINIRKVISSSGEYRILFKSGLENFTLVVPIRRALPRDTSLWNSDTAKFILVRNCETQVKSYFFEDVQEWFDSFLRETSETNISN